MQLFIDAACGCNTGKIRENNEDNFYFDGKCLELDNPGLRNTVCFSAALKNGLCLSVFDGMGGENYGEVASFTAARKTKRPIRPNPLIPIFIAILYSSFQKKRLLFMFCLFYITLSG